MGILLRWDDPLSPAYPTKGASKPDLDRRGCASQSAGWGEAENLEAFVSGPFSRKHDNLQGDSPAGFSGLLSAPASAPRGGSRILALHIEFVAKPSEAHQVHSALPTAIHSAMEGVAGFAGAFVMVSNYEARLVTVVTLWAGEDRSRRCQENVRWVRALLAPYLDRCLRVQTLATYLPPLRATAQGFESAGALERMESGEEPEVASFVA